MTKIQLTPPDLEDSRILGPAYAEPQREPLNGWWEIWEEYGEGAVTIHTRELANLPPVAARDRRIAELEAQIAKSVDALRATRDALRWCGGSDDFNTNGKARAGWLNVVMPALTKACAALAPYKEAPNGN